MAFSHFRLGVDYAPPRGWADFDAVGLGVDLDLIAALGIDLVRVELAWDFMAPGPERVSQVALGKLLSLLDAATARELKVVPAILAGAPGYLDGKPPWDDAAAVRCAVRHLRQVGDRFGEHPAIVAWDLGAGPDRSWGVPSSDAAWLWTHAVSGTFRQLVKQPVLVAFADGAAPWADLIEQVDYAGVAPREREPFARWPQDPLVPAFRAALAAHLSHRPVVVTGFEPPAGEVPSATYHREAVEALWRAGAAGAFAALGALRRDGRVQPQADDLAAICKERRPLQPVAHRLDLDPEQFRTDPDATLRASFHAFAV
jgi:hypothetical protein